jgi:hypothetical protein
MCRSAHPAARGQGAFLAAAAISKTDPFDVDDLMQDAYLHLCDVEFTRITNARAYLVAILRNLLAEEARRARIVPMERLGEIEALRIPSDESGLGPEGGGGPAGAGAARGASLPSYPNGAAARLNCGPFTI